MVHNVIKATYTETYDLNTINNELSVLAIHTPQSASLKKMFKGFFQQYRKMKVVGCSMRMVCASQQKLDPTQVGFGDAQMAPRDVLNPILFKACTGEGMNVLLDTIFNHGEKANTLEGSIDQHLMTNENWINAYYSLLADDSFRKEHPQAGITISGLKPMVHRIVSTQPFKWDVAGNSPRIGGTGDVGASTPDSQVAPFGFGGQSGSANSDTDPVNPSVFISNGLVEMPWLDTAYSQVVTLNNLEGGSKTTKQYVLQSNIPRVYMGALILPPSENLNLYFRAQIQWTILFKDFRPSQELEALTVGSTPIGPDDRSGSLADHDTTYFNFYHTASKLERDVGSFDTLGVENIEVIGEKVA